MHADRESTPEERGHSIVNRLPFFYGWVILAAGTLGSIMTGPGQTYTVSIFIEYMIEDLASAARLSARSIRLARCPLVLSVT